MEKLDLGIKSSQAKSLGTLVSITGAFVVTLYKGLPLTTSPRKYSFLHQVLGIPHSNWIIGGFFLASHSVIFAIILNVQTWIIRRYPAEMLVTLICSIIVAILSSVVSLMVEKDPNAWKIGFNMELIATVYTAAFAVAFRSVVHKWALRKKGPIYVSMFKPLEMVIALAMGIAFLGDKLYLGSLLGAAIIAIGFYAVIWGQAQEEKMVHDAQSSNKDPLLPNTTHTLVWIHHQPAKSRDQLTPFAKELGILVAFFGISSISASPSLFLNMTAQIRQLQGRLMSGEGSGG
ncbi:hypothetical protein Gotur_034477 [Gossypium turneri]